MNAQKLGRMALLTATTGFMVGVALLNGGSSNAIGGLCNGRPASHTWLDASGQYGPALLDGTNKDDDIIDAGDGDDVVCGAAGDDSIDGGDGHDVVRGDTGDDDLSGGSGEDTVIGDGGNDTVDGGDDYDVMLGGSGDDVMISVDNGAQDDVYAGDDFDVCLLGAGDEIRGDCEY